MGYDTVNMGSLYWTLFILNIFKYENLVTRANTGMKEGVPMVVLGDGILSRIND